MLCSVQINRCVFNSDDQRLIYLTVMENMVGEKKNLHSKSQKNLDSSHVLIFN